jgi:hypothetical protein
VSSSNATEIKTDKTEKKVTDKVSEQLPLYICHGL